MTVNKAELVAVIDAALGEKTTTAETDELVQQIVDTIARAVAAGEKVSIYGFGIFEQQHRAARQGRNPRTGEVIRIKKTSTPKFRPSGTFKDIVAGRRPLTRTGLATPRAITPQPAKTTASKAAVRKAAGATAAPTKSASAKKAGAAHTTSTTKAASKKATR